jgi:hypothetical protein
MRTNLVDVGHGRFVAISGKFAGWIYQQLPGSKEVVRAYKGTSRNVLVVSPMDGLRRHIAKKDAQAKDRERAMA